MAAAKERGNRERCSEKTKRKAFNGIYYVASVL